MRNHWAYRLVLVPAQRWTGLEIGPATSGYVDGAHS
jgi:hypothetical protein